ncbi:putative bifunctional diguanylate cyclase/phosphodiesterase [Sphaerotilus sp.]|jgi:diguanylate cyclase (GGDEF)-like protein|uniref:putative bifunctional diguanylate cyclase/phosphodiesterase n=1 Tax=Sphaerotilus sp. TaxID=2093942 RepID=UPI0025FFF1E3|nr:EAL domain-containing protein [Sphaerotilus sp.]
MAPGAARQPRILLVDDDEVNLLLTGAALRERGFTVYEATGGRAALHLLADWSPDVMVLDAVMPGMDGFRTCEALRDLPGFELMPVLMLTGLDDEASIERAFDAGATDFFVKSHHWSLLAGRLRYLLRTSHIQMELLRSRAKLARAQDLARMGSFDWRLGGGLHLEPEALRVIGHGPRAPLSVSEVMHLLVPGARRVMAPLLRDVVRHSTVLDSDMTLRLPDGRERIVHVEAEPEFDDQGDLCGYTGILQDVTERRLIEDKIRHLANFDALTGLPNRRQLIWRAERALEQARRMGHGLALLLIDLDRFKNINDTLGHGQGDELLVEISRRLRTCVHHCDQIADMSLDAAMLRSHRSLEAVGRLGGDEFVALLPEVDGEGSAVQVAQRVLEAMREPVVLGGREYFVTASVGVGLFPRDGVSVVDLLRNADVAMYAAKAAGRNALQVYRPHLAGQGRERLELESALHKAIERKELVLHYQPKVRVGSSTVVAVEALMRWRRDGVLVQPGEFIPLAEETGLIVPMSEWAIGEVARQIGVWRDVHGVELSVAVNLPSRAFERSDLVDLVRSAAERHGLAPRALELEITETGLMQNLDRVIPDLHRLTQIGVEIAIDDFGTGYSSLAYLTQLPISELKIDRSFVRDLGVTNQSAAVVTAVIALAGSLGLKVVAEGVETPLQRDVLLRLGCDQMQGNLFARAMAPEELIRWLSTWAPQRVCPVA